MRDPDTNFYAGVNISVGNNCKYYIEDDFNHMIQRQHLITENAAMPFCICILEELLKI